MSAKSPSSACDLSVDAPMDRSLTERREAHSLASQPCKWAVSLSAASGNCVLPISQAGFTCERDPHIDSCDWTASGSGHFGAANEYTQCGHCDSRAGITDGRRHGTRRGISERRGGRPRRRPPCLNRSYGRLDRGASLCKGKRESACGSLESTLRGRAVVMVGSRFVLSHAQIFASYPV
jgi:hypothetical protein